MTAPVNSLFDAVRTPAHWHPQYEEPIYAEMYGEHFERLAAGLPDGVLVIAEPDDEAPAALLELVDAIDATVVSPLWEHGMPPVAVTA